MSILRSVSPIHLEYLRNMGVRSSMSISILMGGKLWGLIACHHSAPKHVGFETRSAAELFGQMFSYLLEVRQRHDDAAYEIRTRDIHNPIVSAFATSDSGLKEVPKSLAGIEDYIASDGIGVYHSGEVSLTGSTPTAEEFLTLVKFLNKTASGRVFSTHCLSEAFPPAADYVMRAAGFLSIPISRIPREYIVFFRREIVKTVTWAGEPTKIDNLGPNGVRLTPRKSFEAWREIVQNQSERWSANEIRAAEALRITLVELVLRMSEAAQADRLEAKQRQEILVAELNHRVRNIFALMRGLITQSAATYTDIQTLVRSLDERICSMARAHDLMESNNRKAASFHALIGAEVETYAQSPDRVKFIGLDVLLEPKAFATIALVIHELVTNARKYGALLTSGGQITVETRVDEVDNVAISWREAGGPPVAPPSRRGFGSKILEELIPFDLSGVSRPNYASTGFSFDVVLPAAVAHCQQKSAATAFHPGGENQSFDDSVFATLLKRCLLVEDNLFIAVDAEDMLRQLGAGTVELVRSVSEALAALEARNFSFTLLDVNLGDEISLPIAFALKAKNIPFAFGTGYGDSFVRDEALATAPVVTKPYHQPALTKALRQLVSNAAPPRKHGV
jgi:light-regulated signal transduction histidine kinase (bacteriophytochrome)